MKNSSFFVCFWILLFCVLFFESLLFCVLFLVLAHIRIHSEVPTQPPRPWFVVPRTRPWTAQGSSRTAGYDTAEFFPASCHQSSSHADALSRHASCVHRFLPPLSSRQTGARSNCMLHSHTWPCLRPRAAYSSSLHMFHTSSSIFLNLI